MDKKILIIAFVTMLNITYTLGQQGVDLKSRYSKEINTDKEIIIDKGMEDNGLENVDVSVEEQESNTEAVITPEIDALSSRFSPSVKLAGEYVAGEMIKFEGNIFTGNNLNDKSNVEVLYNPNSSSYGINLAAVHSYKLIEEASLAFGAFGAFTEKSLFRDSTTAINFNFIQANFSVELVLFKSISFYIGKNYSRPLSEVASLKDVLRFQEDQNSNKISQSYTNIGFRGQYSFSNDKEYSLAFDINGIKLNKDLQATLKTEDPYLMVIKLSLIKNL